MTDLERFEAFFEPMAPTATAATRKRIKTVAHAAWQASRRAALDEACAAIKDEDDRQHDNDYMLDSDDCIRVIRALANGDAND